MKKLNFYSFLLSFALAATATAAELSPSVFYNKISQRLTGKWPTPQQFQKLKDEMSKRQCQKVGCLEDFFRAEIGRLTDTKEFTSEFYLKFLLLPRILRSMSPSIASTQARFSGIQNQ
jgi:hypothetical protein